MHGVSTHGKTTLNIECMAYINTGQDNIRKCMHGVSTHGKTTLYIECMAYQHMVRQH